MSSATITINQSGRDVVAPSISALSFSNVQQNSIRVSWSYTGGDAPTSTSIEWGINTSYSSGNRVLPAGDTVETITSLSAGVVYFFRVSASNAGGTGRSTGARSTAQPPQPVNGTADWNAPMDTGDTFGGETVITHGDFIVTALTDADGWNPLPSTVTAGQTFTQTRTRPTFSATAAELINQREQCGIRTSPSNGGAAGRCSNPDTAIGGFRSAGTRVFEPATQPVLVTSTVGNGGIQERQATGTLVAVTCTSYRASITRADPRVLWEAGAFGNSASQSLNLGGVACQPGSTTTSFAIVLAFDFVGANPVGSSATAAMAAANTFPQNSGDVVCVRDGTLTTLYNVTGAGTNVSLGGNAVALNEGVCTL